MTERAGTGPTFVAGPALPVAPFESLPDAIARRAVARPSATAVHAPDGILTWAQLDARADAVAAGLARREIGPGDRVAFVGRATAAGIALVAGILRAGAVAAPLGTRLAPAEIDTALEEADPSLVVMGLAPPSGADLPVVGVAELLGTRSRRSGALDVVETDDAVLVMTSGTSGRPKGAVLTHGAMAVSAAAWMAALPPATGWLLCLDLGHVAGLGVAWRALSAGVPLSISDGFRAADVLATLADEGGPSHVSLVPVQLTWLLDEAAGSRAPAGVRAILLGGAPIPPTLVERALATGWPVVPTYGLTEAASGVTALATVEAGAAPWSAGRPLPGMEVRIADPGTDGVGEIQVRSETTFAGYLARPADSLEAWTDDAFLRTGDLGRFDATGRLIVADRRDDLLISGGENVYPAEVEAVLLAHSAIADAAVVGRRDPTWGQVPVAAIVLHGGAPGPTAGELTAFCTDRLARFKVPVAFVEVAALPRTPSGKVRRAEVWALVRPSREPGA